MGKKTRKSKKKTTVKGHGRHFSESEVSLASLDVDLIELSFAALVPHREELAELFRVEWLDSQPVVAALFEGLSIEEQRDAILTSLDAIVKNLRKPKAFDEVLQELAECAMARETRHVEYAAAANTLLHVMAEVAGDLWTAKVESMWTRALCVVVDGMLGASKKVGGLAMASAKSGKTNGRQNVKTGAEVEMTGKLAAIDKAQAVIEFNMDGTVIVANQNFLDLTGYSLEEISGHHHRMFVEPSFAESPEYREFWAKLGRGEYEAGQFKRIGKEGKEVWMEASYNPILNLVGEPFKVVKYATDVTEQVFRNADVAGQLAAISRLQGVVEFDMDGKVISANEKFLESVGYSLEDVKGRHHRMFVEPAEAEGAEYREFWAKIRDGVEFEPAQYKRIGKDGKKVWQQASYIPIRDLNGQPFKVMKYVTDVTEQKSSAEEMARLKVAIDDGATPIMTIDRDLVINYVNKASMQLFTKYEEVLRKLYPGFAADQVLGICIDRFHSNPAHQRRLLADPNNLPRRVDIKVGPLSFNLVVTAILTGDGNCIGNSVVWQDMTDQRNAQADIDQLINDATQGNLDGRLETVGFEGFFKDLGDGINRLLDVVVEPTRASIRLAQALEGGDLTARMHGEYDGEFGVLRDAMHNTMENLEQVVSKVLSASSAVADSSSQIRAGNADLNSRTQQQASALEECSATLQELNEAVKQDSENAKQATEMAGNARVLAEKGGQIVGQAIDAMAEINTSSKKIADIIGVIDEIAFQTNLLALNAAVEAARAGEQGRGFAVVAAEVRNLAQRSAGAAKEIKGLINESLEKVGDGSKLVDKSGRTLEEIVTGVKSASDLMTEIAAAVQDRSIGIEEVSKAVIQMDEMTQRNSALVEEVSAASDSTEKMAKDMVESMTFFKLDARIESGATDARFSQTDRSPATTRSAPRPMMNRLGRRSGATGDDEWEEF